MTRNEAYKTFKCFHCAFCDKEEGICTAGDPESDDCPRCKDDESEKSMTENKSLIKDENEAIEALKLINTSRVHPFYSWEEMTEVRDISIKALEEVQEYRKIGTIEEVKEAVEKQKPKKVIIRAWEPCKCPTCSKELSKSMGDGYYKHYYYLKRCTECGQKLNWGDNDD